MTKEFENTLIQYRGQFVSAENPMSFIAMFTMSTLADLMNQAIEANEPLEFDFKTKDDNIIPDNIFVKIGEKIVY